MDSKRKTQIVNDWQKLLPGSKKYTPNNLYANAGPVVYGLEFMFSESAYGSDYTVYFRMYAFSPNRFKGEFKSVLRDAVAQYQLRSRKGLQLHVSIPRHEEEFEKDKEFFLSQVYLPFTGLLKMSDIEKCLRFYMKTQIFSLMDISTLEFKFALYQYLKLDRSIILQQIQSIEAIAQTWNEKACEYFLRVYKVSISDYISSLYKELDHPEEKLSVMHEWMSNPKLKKLNDLEIIYDL